MYILLSSAKGDLSDSRSFNEFHSRDELAKTIVDYYEDWLTHREVAVSGQEVTPETTNDNPLEYKSDDIYNFIDDFFEELCCLAKQEGHKDLYVPYTSDWVKESIFLYFRSTMEKKNPDRNKLDKENMMPRPTAAMDID